MTIEIKHKNTGEVIFVVEGDTLAEADLYNADLAFADLTGADLTRANLAFAKLWDANLTRANFTGADLAGADLTGADLYRANLNGVRGNKCEVKSLHASFYDVAWTKDQVQIGCKNHSKQEWLTFDDASISRMSNNALKWWKEWKPKLITLGVFDE